MRAMPELVTVFQVAKLRRWTWEDGMVQIHVHLPDGQKMEFQGSRLDCDRWLEEKGYRPMEQTR